MSDNDVKDSPSADDIVDDVTDEMGVDESSDEKDESTDQQVSDDEETPDGAADDDAADESEDSTDDDRDVEASDDDDDDRDVEASDDGQDDDDDEESPTSGDVDGQLAGVDDIIEPDDTGYLDVNADVDVDQFSLVDVEGENKWLNKQNIAIALAVCVAIMGALYFITDDEYGNVYSDIALLVQGQYLEDMQRRVDQTEQEFIEAQEEVIPDYGNLFISGSPREALIQLDGQIQYGEVPAGGQYRELRVEPDTVIQDLPVDEDHEIEIDHPGFETYEITLTEDMWEPAGADYGYNLSVNLTPESREAHQEFQQRMQTDTEERGEERFFGTVDFNTTPPGALLKINSYFARDEDGYKIETPVELDEYWVLDIDVGELYEEGVLEELVGDEEELEQILTSIEEDKEAAEEAREAAEEGELDEEEEEEIEEVDKLERLSDVDPRDLDIDERALRANHDELAELEEEPRQFPVDRPPDRGDSIQIIYPDDHDDAGELYNYATMLQRAMWECEFKDDLERDRLDEDDPIQEHCDYYFEFDKDFYDIADYIEWRKEEQERVEEERYRATEQLDDLEEEFDDQLRALGTSIDEVDRIEPEDDDDYDEQDDG